MINRSLIRVKVLQVLYSYYRGGALAADAAVGSLRSALESDYRVYLYLCGIPTDLASAAMQRISIEEGKYSPDEERLAILHELADNPVVSKLEGEEEFILRRQATALFHRPELGEYHEWVLEELLEEPDRWLCDGSDFEAMRRLYREIYEEYYRQSDRLYDLLEASDTYITDADLPVIFSFVTKVFNGLAADKPLADLIRPKFASEEDATFGPKLLREVIDRSEEYRSRISNYFMDWDADRVSDIDYLILTMAMAEAIAFPTIATTVTINEYLNLAHAFSSDNSYIFINGILFKLFGDLKAEGLILGD